MDCQEDSGLKVLTVFTATTNDHDCMILVQLSSSWWMDPWIRCFTMIKLSLLGAIQTAN